MTDEILKDEELEEVVGGTGLECIGLMTRLQAAGLAKFNTPLTQGNEAAAAKELQAFFDTFSTSDGPNTVKFEVELYSDGRANHYAAISYRPGYDECHSISVDQLVDLISRGQR